MTSEAQADGGASGGCHHGRQADVRNRSPPPLVREQRALELCGAQGRQVVVQGG